MRKKIVLIMLCVLLVATVLVGFAACNKDDGIKITVWVGEGTDGLTKQLIDEFNATNEFGIKFNATIEMVSESKAAGDALSKKDSAADIFTFSQDQLARLVAGGMLMNLGSTSTSFIEENNDADSVEAAKIGGEIKAFPFTADNGFFMYYDKDVFKGEKENDLNDLDAILTDCKAAGKNFSMNLDQEGGAWYAASFFYATGCVSEWTTDANGAFINYNDTFNSDNGVIAIKGIKKVLSSGCYSGSDKIGEFNAGTESAVVISGIWDYNAAKTALGNNLGIAPLPSFWVDENGNDMRDEAETHQLVSFLGRKMLGIKPQKDANMSRYLQALARFLTSKECQQKRFDAVGWGPSNKELQETDAVKASECLKVLAEEKSVNQGQYPQSWWAEVQSLAGNANAEEATIREKLGIYYGNLPGVMQQG